MMEQMETMQKFLTTLTGGDSDEDTPEQRSKITSIFGKPGKQESGFAQTEQKRQISAPTPTVRHTSDSNRPTSVGNPFLPKASPGLSTVAPKPTVGTLSFVRNNAAAVKAITGGGFDPESIKDAGTRYLNSMTGTDGIKLVVVLMKGLWSNRIGDAGAASLFDEYVSSADDSERIVQTRSHAIMREQAMDFDKAINFILVAGIVQKQYLSASTISLAFSTAFHDLIKYYVVRSDLKEILMPKLFYSKAALAEIPLSDALTLMMNVCFATNAVLITSKQDKFDPKSIEGALKLAYPVSPWNLTHNYAMRKLKRTDKTKSAVLLIFACKYFGSMMVAETEDADYFNNLAIDVNFRIRVAQKISEIQKKVREFRTFVKTGRRETVGPQPIVFDTTTYEAVPDEDVSRYLNKPNEALKEMMNLR